MDYSLIAIIDDGISTYGEMDGRVVLDLYVDSKGRVRERTCQEKICTEHGTICACIINKYAQEARFCSLKVFDGPILRTNISRIIAALQWCYEHNITLIHLSVGTKAERDYEKMNSIIYALHKKGCIIVAAISNQSDTYTLPADLCGVISVGQDLNLEGCEYASNLSCALSPNMYASSSHILQVAGSEKYTTKVNSYAAPVISAAIYNSAKLSGYSRYMIWNTLGITGECNTFLPDFLLEAIVYDPEGMFCNKEDYLFKVVHYCKNLDELSTIMTDDTVTSILIMREAKLEACIISHIAELCCNRVGVVFCGRNRMLRKLTSKKCLYWDEESIENAISTQRERGLGLEVFYIAIIANQTITGLNFSIKLKNGLLDKGYNCQVFSDIPASYLYGIVNLPNKELSDYVLNQYCDEHHIDAGIVVSNNRSLVNNMQCIKLAGEYLQPYMDECGVIHCCESLCEMEWKKLYKLLIDE